MAHLDENGVVVNISVEADDKIEAETLVTYFENGNFLRVNPAIIGGTFDPDKGTDGAFIPPQPFESWVLDEDTCLWVAPVPYPAEGDFAWDEEAGDWVEVTEDTVE
tara:strand:+ start:1006 stop:1323 length:318 start_codon:yes stop_codon:yes gene_type:complete